MRKQPIKSANHRLLFIIINFLALIYSKVLIIFCIHYIFTIYPYSLNQNKQISNNKKTRGLITILFSMFIMLENIYFYKKKID